MLNLITDAWIPIITRDGARRVITPAHMTDPDMWRPDWPRADLNIACLELLIGLAYMSCPCADLPSWRRSAATPPDMHNSLAPYAHAFELLGDGPRFLQDLEPLDGSPAPPDMLFIDSAGGNTAKNNADLAVHRDRYAALDLPLAAMALYTLQAHAPSGGAGNRTSMRGGGPLVTLIEPSPDCTLWDMIWANVPYGTPAKPKDLPWMRATRTSKAKGTEVTPPGNLPYSIEAFFGMPRRLRLMATQDQITGVIQKPYGTNYALWKHPLSPHYRLKSTTEWLPKHPKPGQFGYRNWLGIVSEAKNTDVAERAWIVSEAETRFQGSLAQPSMLVAGWAMSNMKPLDFTYSRQPIVPENITLEVAGLVEAAEGAALALRRALTDILSEGEAREAEREQFYTQTEAAFLTSVMQLRNGQAIEDVGRDWLATLSHQVKAQFHTHALPGLETADIHKIARIVAAQRGLFATMAGYTKLGRDIFSALLREPPKKATKRNAA